MRHIVSLWGTFVLSEIKIPSGMTEIRYTLCLAGYRHFYLNTGSNYSAVALMLVNTMLSRKEKWKIFNSATS
jgi:hypothetical protein